mgnify:CR=1 FL=1
MVGLAEYFAKLNTYKPKYFIGDRVFGKWNKIPFVASVLRDEESGVMVHADLPIKYKEEYQTLLIIPHKDVKLLKEF